MSEFKNGQRVKVELEGKIIDTYSHDACVKILDDDTESGGWNHYVYLMSPAVKVTPAGPAGWPPQVGDIWATRDGFGPVGEWFCQSSRMHGFVMRSEDTSNTRVVLDEFKALNPVLVRRRGQ